MRVLAAKETEEGGTEWVEAVPPPLLLRTPLSRRGRGARPLTGIALAPMVDLDGTVLDRPGYDERTGLVLAVDAPEEFAPPDGATLADTRAAYRYLEEEAFAEFDFATRRDAAAAVAMLLTALERRLLRRRPAS